MALESSLDLFEEFRRGKGRIASEREVRVLFHECRISNPVWGFRRAGGDVVPFQC